MTDLITCPSCGKADAAVTVNTPERVGYSCKLCGSTATRPRPRPTVDEKDVYEVASRAKMQRNLEVEGVIEYGGDDDQP